MLHLLHQLHISAISVSVYYILEARRLCLFKCLFELMNFVDENNNLLPLGKTL